MHHPLPLSLIALLTLGSLQATALSNLRSPIPRTFLPGGQLEKRDAPHHFETSSNGTEYIWLIKDTYQGKTFFDRWSFFSEGDPTHGTVDFVNVSTAWDTGLIYITDDDKVIMKGDNTTWLSSGQVRPSVRISSIEQYTGGLFILDLNKAPWGCGVWPAFWTCGPNWPYGGEIDILEGVHDNEHNQVTWHTGPGCNLTPNYNFTGTPVGELDCDGTLPGNPGCGITEWSRASYGPYFDAQGGGVFAMKWDEDGIAVWNFYRASIPQDITDGESPNPSTWGEPGAVLAPSGCDPFKFFANHSIIFDITFCGDWAGNSYATSGCPGSCADRIMDPGNFVNASWSINYLKVFQKQVLAGQITGAAVHTTPLNSLVLTGLLLLLTVGLIGL